MPPAEAARRLLRRACAHDDREFVAAQPRDGIVAPDGLGQAGRRDLQQDVAGIVAKRVVHVP